MKKTDEINEILKSCTIPNEFLVIDFRDGLNNKIFFDFVRLSFFTLHIYYIIFFYKNQRSSMNLVGWQ